MPGQCRHVRLGASGPVQLRAIFLSPPGGLEWRRVAPRSASRVSSPDWSAPWSTTAYRPGTGPLGAWPPKNGPRRSAARAIGRAVGVERPSHRVGSFSFPQLDPRRLALGHTWRSKCSHCCSQAWKLLLARLPSPFRHPPSPRSASSHAPPLTNNRWRAPPFLQDFLTPAIPPPLPVPSAASSRPEDTAKTTKTWSHQEVALSL